MTPLHVVAEKGDRLDVVKYLLDKGADINIKDYNGVSETINNTDPTESFLSIVHVFTVWKKDLLAFNPWGFWKCVPLKSEICNSQYI